MDQAAFQGNVVRSRRIIYTPSVFAKANLIHMQEVGELQAERPHESRRENLSSYLFFVVEKGSGELEYQGARWQLKAGDCVFLDCQKGYLHRSSEELWTLRWTHFYGPNMGGIYRKYVERGGKPSFTPEEPAQFTAILQELQVLAASDEYIRDMKIYEKLTALLTLLMAESWQPGEQKRSIRRRQNLQEIKEYLDNHYAEKITLDDLAERFYINKFYLTRIFKEQFGVPVNGYLLQLRITHAKQLLRFTDWTIERVGQECGMDDPNYFARAFKKIEGTTPGEYRRNW